MANNSSQNYIITKLTKELADVYSDEILTIHNIIPHQSWNKCDLLSVSDCSRNYVGKWEYSGICLVSGVVVGLCIAFEMDWGLYIHRLAVDNRWQSKYIGTKLILFVVGKYANSTTLERVVRVQTPVEISRDEEVIGFYEKIGFVQYGRKKYEKREDYILEEKTDMILMECRRKLRMVDK